MRIERRLTIQDFRLPKVRLYTLSTIGLQNSLKE